ncbi:MAG TPA: prolyl oligopeptidase family serine peptidase [Pseudonocardiaceae bacterium]|nr:prolyl oligopeptidase family serine peptidase [Pseudonocardiaceae bacterium]
MIASSSADDPAEPFADLDAYVGLPRVGGLWLSPDGSRLVVGLAMPDREQTRFASALWEVDPTGTRPARRLTRSAEGESSAAFTPGGDLLFVSARPDPAVAAEDKPVSALWLQPAGGGDARVVAAPPGGLRGLVVARESGTVALGSALMPSSADLDADLEIRKKRKDSKVSAILHEEYPVRYWDHDLGPARTRLLAADISKDLGTVDDQLDLRDLTGHIGGALHDESGWDIAADGRTIVTTWAVPEPAGSQRSSVIAIDVATGERRVLADDAEHEYESPRLSPDGTRMIVTVQRRYTPQEPGDSWLAVLPTAGGEIQPLTRAWDRWPHAVRWTPDGGTLVVVADDHGHAPLWRVDVATGEATRLTEDGAFSDPQVSPDGRWVYALRSSVDHPPAPVRLALDGSSPVEYLPGPAEALGLAAAVPGRLEQVETVAADGTSLRAWLALPHGAGAEDPVTMLLWIHGGPLGSWNAWSWRWNPWLAVAKGYAVLLPDPALSVGYGIDFIRRAWGHWGGVPYTDLMAITDAAEARPDIDETRTAAMGGSYGGYMANWVAGHTDRFTAIIAHASVWSLEQLGTTTDGAFYWTREMDAAMADANSPHHFADSIHTPMLVIHGDKDYRVPISEGLRLWWDLSSRVEGTDGSSPHKFLYFPDENHWILTPNHVKVWYGTIFAFLAQHVRGEEWVRPEILG